MPQRSRALAVCEDPSSDPIPTQQARCALAHTLAQCCQGWTEEADCNWLPAQLEDLNSRLRERV